MNEVKKIDSKEFQRLINSKINISLQFSDDLDEVSSKIYSKVDEKLTAIDDTVFKDYKNKLTVNELYQLARKWFLRESKRITIEMFPTMVMDDEKNYVMDRSYSLNDKNYEILTIDEIVKKKFETR